MMNNPRVIAEAVTFLRTGHFDHGLTLLDAVLDQLGCPEAECLPGIEASDAER